KEAKALVYQAENAPTLICITGISEPAGENGVAMRNKVLMDVKREAGLSPAGCLYVEHFPHTNRLTVTDVHVSPIAPGQLVAGSSKNISSQELARLLSPSPLELTRSQDQERERTI